MRSQPSSVKFTYEDYLLFPEDGRRHELIAGDHYVTPAPNTKHQRVIANLGALLVNLVKAKRLGTVLFAPCDVIFSDFDVVQPDLLYISANRQSIITEKNIQGAPDLVIEVLSDASRRTDELIKKKTLRTVRSGGVLDRRPPPRKLENLSEVGDRRVRQGG